MSTPDPASDARAAWLALIRTPGIGGARLRRLVEHFADPVRVFAAGRGELRGLGLPDESVAALAAPDRDALARDLRWLGQPDCHLVTFPDTDYPVLLREAAGAPPALFVRGDPAVLGNLQLAIVGSRNPTPQGRRNAFDFARFVAGAGLTVTSGLALGIDGEAHRGALDAGGTTVAVLGTGTDRIYPARHRDLAHRIVDEGGALVSELAPGTAPAAEHFPRRNRIISGLSVGVLVVEAAVRSGSLITARLAADQGREVFAIPGSIHNALARGCHALIRQGAKLVESGADILEELGSLAGAAIGPAPAAAADAERSVESDHEYRRLIAELGDEPVSVDALVQRTGLTADAVSSMLLILELRGLVAAMTGGHYCRLPNRDG